MGATEIEVELVVDAAAYVGEGPMWHPAKRSCTGSMSWRVVSIGSTRRRGRTA